VPVLSMLILNLYDTTGNPGLDTVPFKLHFPVCPSASFTLNLFICLIIPFSSSYGVRGLVCIILSVKFFMTQRGHNSGLRLFSSILSVHYALSKSPAQAKCWRLPTSASYLSLFPTLLLSSIGFVSFRMAVMCFAFARTSLHFHFFHKKLVQWISVHFLAGAVSASGHWAEDFRENWCICMQMTCFLQCLYSGCFLYLPLKSCC